MDTVFSLPTINKYRTNPIIVNALNGVTLLNYDEFKEWFNPDIRHSSRQSVANDPFVQIRRQLSSSRKDLLSDEILKLLVSTVCKRPNSVGRMVEAIGRDYGISAIERLKTNTFDVLFAVDDQYNSVAAARSTDATAIKKMEHIVGFIILEYGECKTKPTVWSVNLICTTTNIRRKTIKSTLLLGAYLYCIRNSAFTKECILELAGGYTNMPGFISYTRMGFKKDTSLYNNNCFEDFNNLPMSVIVAGMSGLSDATIIDRSAGIQPHVTIRNGDQDVYTLGIASPANSKRQELYLTIKNMLYKFSLNNGFRKFTTIYTSGNGPHGYLNDNERGLYHSLITRGFQTESGIVGELEKTQREIYAILKQGTALITTAPFRLLTPVNVGIITVVLAVLYGVCRNIGFIGGLRETENKPNGIFSKQYDEDATTMKPGIFEKSTELDVSPENKLKVDFSEQYDQAVIILETGDFSKISEIVVSPEKKGELIDILSQIINTVDKTTLEKAIGDFPLEMQDDLHTYVDKLKDETPKQQVVSDSGFKSDLIGLPGNAGVVEAFGGEYIKSKKSRKSKRIRTRKIRTRKIRTKAKKSKRIIRTRK